ncbi:Unknown protein sequence [Pseudomonas syringae pv. tomato]|nr:Unknown protein sequence [Pseudomonas syringae pv. philadelphi]KPY93469.1 Unknown protein sequence [Pseudomonas syringae pv. tomato]RMP64557.1 hypothetical protein ALQ19_03384 [Pseudomonas syringae pv. berberidis]
MSMPKSLRPFFMSDLLDVREKPGKCRHSGFLGSG